MTVGLLSFVSSSVRTLVIGYGQSNMDVFFQNTHGGTVANANTFFYNGSITTPPTSADGIINFGNAVNNATGIPVLSLVGSVGGSGISALGKGTTPYNNLLAQIQAVIQPSDRCVILWLQGEGDADSQPHEDPDVYATTLGQLHSDLTSDIGRTTSNCPFLVGSISTINGIADGTVDGGTTPFSWTNIRWQQFAASQRSTPIFSHSNIDSAQAFVDYHYVEPTLTNNGLRFAQTYLTYLGLRSGAAHWEISTAATVSGTVTNVNVVQNLGTDFTPTSGIVGFEVSGDNGATWLSATGARNSATQIALTHSSISTTSARLVRYQYGFDPPGIPALTGPPPANLVADNSSLALPLTPTGIWNIRPAPLSAIPVPTWRDYRGPPSSAQVQAYPGMQIGNDGVRRFLIMSLMGVGISNPTVTVTPNVGTAVSASVVKFQGNGSILQAILLSDAATATRVDVTVDYGQNPFGGSILQLWTVPFADLSSTTATGTGGSTTASSLTGTATVNVSAGGFIIAATRSGTTYTNFSSATSGYAIRGESPSGIISISADASNQSANASSSFTWTVNVAGTLDVALAAWR